MNAVDILGDSCDHKVAAILDTHIEAHALHFVESFHSLRSACESPIEEQFLAALFGIARAGPVPLTFDRGGFDARARRRGAVCFLQAKLYRYRVDFLVATPAELIAIECDGHDFHERTRQQAIRDRSRDRTMTVRGVKVMRFTGSEIWNDPIACAEQIMDMIGG